MLDKSAQAEEPLGFCPDTHKPVFVKVGRFGPYVQRGTAEDDDKPQNASLLKDMKPEDVDLAIGLETACLCRGFWATIRIAACRWKPTTAATARMSNAAMIPARWATIFRRSMSPWSRPWPFLAQPKIRRGTTKGSKEPIKVFDPSPVTNQPVRVLSGRYGPYVTDGVTNASLPKDAPPEEITFEYALNLLAARVEAGPGKRSFRRKSRPKPPAKPAAKPPPSHRKNPPARKK